MGAYSCAKPYKDKKGFTNTKESNFFGFGGVLPEMQSTKLTYFTTAARGNNRCKFN